MKFIRARNLPDAWFRVNKVILEEGTEFKVGRGSEEILTKKIAVALEVTNPEERPLADDKAPAGDLNKYVLENMYIADRLGYDYTYGDRLRNPYDQIERVIEKFKEEPMDRQNVMITRRPEDLDRENPPCLTVVDLEILNGKLVSYSYWRSWDAYAGLPSNLGGLQLLAEHMAKEIGVGTGEMVAFSKNLHLYKRQFDFVENLVSGGSDEDRLYRGNWRTGKRSGAGSVAHINQAPRRSKE